jgi:hypothetical protein
VGVVSRGSNQRHSTPAEAERSSRADHATGSMEGDPEKGVIMVKKVKRTWYGRKKVVEEPQILDVVQEVGPEKRPTMLYAPFYNGVAAALSISESSHLLGGFHN